MSQRFLHFIAIFLVFSPLKAVALPQFRCSGRIQYRPCNDDRAIPALLIQKGLKPGTVSAPAERAQMKSQFVAPTVFSTNYLYNKERKLGVWTGFVHGDGPVVLYLKLYRSGQLAESRYMGKAVLRGRPSPFEFRSTPPKTSGWDWYITAKNEDS